MCMNINKVVRSHGSSQDVGPDQILRWLPEGQRLPAEDGGAARAQGWRYDDDPVNHNTPHRAKQSVQSVTSSVLHKVIVEGSYFIQILHY